jgi:phosphoribosyl-ATP pyrophosphohydrolase/phosphoribosyl-AMP cyclohydrolase
MIELDLDQLDFAKGGGTITVIAQDAVSGRVLMVAAADRDAVERTVATGEMHYRSRTRGLWHKGATSGNRQRVVRLVPDCDGDALLALIDPAGPACHTGEDSCFAAGPPGFGALERLDAAIASRARRPDLAASYTARLLADRNLRLKKLGEEVAELVAAAAEGEGDRAVEEAADLLYHALVAVTALGKSGADIAEALLRRRRSSA